MIWERLSVKVRGFCGFCKSHSFSWPVGALWDSRHTGAYGPEMGGGMVAGGDRKIVWQADGSQRSWQSHETRIRIPADTLLIK